MRREKSGILEVPEHRFAKTIRKGREGPPNELPLNLVGRDRVAEVVSGTVFDESDEFVVTVSRPGTQFVEECADRPDDLEIRLFVVSAHVVALARASFVKDDVDRAAMVAHPEPVAYVFARSVDGNGLVRETLADHRGDELLVVLPGTVVVRAVRDRDVHPVGAGVGLDEEVGRSLARRVGTARRVGRLLREEPFGTETPVDLVGRDVVKAGGLQSAALVPVEETLVQKRRRSYHVRFDEAKRIGNGIVDVALRREVKDAFHVELTQGLVKKRRIADVAVNGHDVFHLALPLEDLPAGRIGEKVEIDEPIAGMPFGEVVDEVGADEAGAPRDEEGFLKHTESCVGVRREGRTRRVGGRQAPRP